MVATPAEARRLEHGAAIVLDPLRQFLDEAGLGRGDLSAEPIGDGHSNLSFLLRRGADHFVLRRPPRGELSPSANDVLREARVLDALATAPIPVPEVLASGEDPALIGAPFFIMSFVEGTVLGTEPEHRFADPAAPRSISEAVVRTLVELHGLDVQNSELGGFGRQSGYLERQLRTFSALLEHNASRPLPDLDAVGAWLADNRPETAAVSFVHGDYRLGNMIFGDGMRLAAVLDWEMATIGDPLADLGYLTAMWRGPGDRENPMFALSRLTAGAGWLGREEMARSYAELTGRSVESLPWYQVLALWKSAIFLEGSYRRFTNGASADPYFATLEQGVPLLAATARQWIEAAESPVGRA
ncbi:MAG: phosphotransferase family protein [Actinobacteria bacterium]|nr:phosphotransferase family protein [Actinomycetota bacterium]